MFANKKALFSNRYKLKRKDAENGNSSKLFIAIVCTVNTVDEVALTVIKSPRKIYFDLENRVLKCPKLSLFIKPIRKTLKLWEVV